MADTDQLAPPSARPRRTRSQLILDARNVAVASRSTAASSRPCATSPSSSTTARRSRSSASPAPASRSPRAPSCGSSPSAPRVCPTDPHHPRRRRHRPHVADADARAARQPHLDDLPGADVVAEPGLHGRQADRRRSSAAHSDDAQRGDGARARAARGGAHPRARGAARAISAPALRRPAPARDDRHGARQPPRLPDRRRADHRARRHRAGADPQPDQRPQGRATAWR